MRLDLSVTVKQKRFIDASATEVLFGGAAGGGKSYGQLVDALLYAVKYPGSKQLILRRTFSELEKSLIRVHLGLYPLKIYTYNATAHTGRFKNGSTIDFGYCATENDVYQYQSAEYDVIRFDELTHFTETQYVYLLSRLRGANPFPKTVKSSTNPGGVGHSWVKERFIDPAPADTLFYDENGNTRIFIPSKVDDNHFLMKSDPMYKVRLLALSEKDRKALLYGDWNIFEGQYFTEFDPALHVCEPFPIPKEWRRWRAFDYGLDRFACLWIAKDSTGCTYVYREYCESDLVISAAASAAIKRTEKDEDIYLTYAPPDMWSRSQETGRSKADLFYEAGLRLCASDNNREAGWLALKEMLKADVNGDARLKIFSTCRELIKCLPSLVRDERRPTDCATEPHTITHAPDALRYYAIMHNRATPIEDTLPSHPWTRDMYEDYQRASSAEREMLLRRWGRPK